MGLLDLPDHVLLSIILAPGALCGKDLAALEATARRFCLRSVELKSSSAAATLPECAAEELLGKHTEGWRLAPRPADSWKYLFQLVCSRLSRIPVVAAGQAHTLAVADGKLLSFGANDCLQLGLGGGGGEDPDKAVGRVGEEHVDSFEASPRQVTFPGESTQIMSVAAGSAHSAAVSLEGKLWTWGEIEDGKLGHGLEALTDLMMEDLQATEDVFRTLMNKAVGAPRLVRTFLPASRIRVVQVACGDDHSACLSATGTAFTWGLSDGRLGRGGPQDDFDYTGISPGLVTSMEAHRVVAVECGESQTSFVTCEEKILTQASSISARIKCRMLIRSCMWVLKLLFCNAAEGELYMCGLLVVTEEPTDEDMDLYRVLWAPERINFPTPYWKQSYSDPM